MCTYMLVYGTSITTVNLMVNGLQCKYMFILRQDKHVLLGKTHSFGVFYKFTVVMVNGFDV